MRSKLPDPSFYSPSDFMLPVRHADRRKRALPVALERRKGLRRRDDRLAAGAKGE